MMKMMEDFHHRLLAYVELELSKLYMEALRRELEEEEQEQEMIECRIPLSRCDSKMSRLSYFRAGGDVSRRKTPIERTKTCFRRMITNRGVIELIDDGTPTDIVSTYDIDLTRADGERPRKASNFLDTDYMDSEIREE